MRFFQPLLFTVLLFSGLVLSAQPDAELNEPTEKANLSSPAKTVATHLTFLQPESYQPEISAKTFNIKDAEKAKELAIQLKQYMDAEGLYADVEVMPSENDYVDTSTGLNRYRLFEAVPEIYVERKEGKWYYSRRTAEAIPELHSSKFPWGSDILFGLFPEFGHKEFLGLQVRQYIGIFFLILISFVFHAILTWFLGIIIGWLAKRYGHFEAQIGVLNKVSKPLSWLVVTALLVYAVPMLLLPIYISKYVVIFLKVLTPVFGTFAMYYFVDLIGHYFEEFSARTENTLDDQLVPLVKKSLKVFVVIIGVLIILQNLNFNITALLAGISIGGLALALAAQDTVKNLFGSLMIFIDRPFQIGDWVNFNGVDGTVEEVGFRSTRVRTFANSLVSVPNGQVADTAIDNFGLRTYRRFKTSISLTYDTPPDLIDAYVKGLREIVKSHPLTRKDYYEIHMNNMGAHSLDILFYIFFEVPSWSDELKARHEVILQAIRLADELDVRFAFPTQTLHVEEVPGQRSLTPVYEESAEDMNKKVAAFIERYKVKDDVDAGE